MKEWYCHGTSNALLLGIQWILLCKPLMSTQRKMLTSCKRNPFGKRVFIAMKKQENHLLAIVSVRYSQVILNSSKMTSRETHYYVSFWSNYYLLLFEKTFMPDLC